MAKKTKTITIEPIKMTTVRMELIGDRPLMLHGKSRYYVKSECWRQNHDKGSKMPEIYCQGKNVYEGLITSIHWEKPIEFHDENIMLYTEEELKHYLETNRPCILAHAFKQSLLECFITFYKDSTGKNGTDVKRAISINNSIHPVDFESWEIGESLPTTKAFGGSPVVCNANVFNGWRTMLEVSCPDNVFPIETVIQMVETAGKFLGIGSRRGDNEYGTYHINPENVVIF